MRSGPLTFYVSPAGSDSSTGTSPAAPWQTLDRVNAQALLPGDSVLFLGGSTWTGQLHLTSPGTALSPITIGSYGAFGPAAITNTGAGAIFGDNVGGYLITGISTPGGDSGFSGINFFASGTGQLPAVTVANFSAARPAGGTGWKYGVLFGGSGSADGWNGITVANGSTDGSVYAGVLTYGPAINPASPAWNHRNVLVQDVTANYCLGSASVTGQWTGSGIVIGNADGGLVTGCTAHDGGSLNGCTTEGPAAIWTYASRGVVITGNLAYSYKSGTGVDGDGFDIDIDCTGCTVEYNVSYGNAGAGVLCFGGTADSYWGSSAANTVRYNICWGNSAGSTGYGELALIGNLAGLNAYGNTLAGLSGPALAVGSGTMSGCGVWNSILYQLGAAGAVTSVLARTTAEVSLAGNWYWASGALSIGWGVSSYGSLASWRTASGQEAGTGTQADPQLTAPGAVPAVTSPADLAPALGLQPRPGSPAARSGLDIETLFSVVPGARDVFGSPLSVPLPAGASMALTQPAYPDGPLDERIELLLGAAWTDITGAALPDGADSASIASGQQAGSMQVTPARMNGTWDNPDGRFSPRNSAGPWFGQLRQNTPARVSVKAVYGSYLRLEANDSDRAYVNDTAVLHVTGDIEARIELRLSDWAACTLAARLDGSLPSWYWQLLDGGRLGWAWYDSGGTGRVIASTAAVPFTTGVFALRVTQSAATGAVTFYASDSIDGTWTQLGDPVSAPGVTSTSIRAGNAPLVVGWSANLAGYLTGEVYGFRLYSGSSAAADAAFSGQPGGAQRWTDTAGCTWRLAGGAEVSDRDYRLHAEVPSMIPQADTSGALARVAVQMAGRLRRLQAGRQSPDSPIKRAILTQPGILYPVAYWPGEDLAGASALGSATGGAPMVFDGSLQLAGDSSFAASGPIPVLNGAGLRGTVAPYTGATAWTVRFLLKVGSPPSAATTLIRIVALGSACPVTYVNMDANGNLELIGYAPDGSEAYNTGYFAYDTKDGLWMSVEAQPVSGGVQYSLVDVAPGAHAGGALTQVVTSSRGYGTVSLVQVNVGSQLEQVTVGHIQVQRAWVSMFSLGAPLAGWKGETAAARVRRICGEENIPVRIIGWAGDSAAMGPQPADTVAAILQDCADTDQGLLFEPLAALGAGYRTLASMLNQSPAAVLDFAASDFPGNVQPADDDTDLGNDWTVSQPGGASVRVALDDGSGMSVSEYPAGAGSRPKTANANTATVDALGDAAGWRVNTGTPDEARYRTLPADFGIPGAPAADLARLRPGDMIAVQNVPAVYGAGDVRQLYSGLTEVLGPGRRPTYACIPASPYDVGTWDDDGFRWDTAGSVLVSDVTAAAATLQVQGGQVPWTATAASLPFDVQLGQEQVTVTAVTGTSDPQTLTVTRAVNGVAQAHDAGALVRLWTPPRLAT